MIIAVVVPCYNEEEVLRETSSQLNSLFDSLVSKGKIDNRSKIYFVDDGSRDRTWSIIS